MNDMRDDLRELLRRKAGDLPVHRDVPRTLSGRARRRIALNALGVGLLVFALAGGAVTAVRTFGSESLRQPVRQPPAVSASGTPASSTTATCSPALLRAVGTTEGAAGSVIGAITIENLSSSRCTLEGSPTVTLVTSAGEPITSGLRFTPSPAQWQAQDLPKPPGWPVVALHPGDKALVRFSWNNWCPAGREVPLWRLDMPGGGSVDVTGLDQLPPCNGQGEPSTIEVGPFEPNPPA